MENGLSISRHYWPKCQSQSDWLLVMNNRMLPPEEWMSLVHYFSQSKSGDRDYQSIDAKIIAAVKATAAIMRLSVDEDNLDRHIKLSQKLMEAA